MTEGEGRGSYDAGSGWPGSPGSPAAAAQAGGIPFRPLSLGEIFNGAITSMRRSPPATLGMAALLSVAASLATALITLEVNHLRGTGRVAGPAAGALVDGADILITFVANTLSLGTLAVVVSRSVLGMSTSLSQVWQYARPRLPVLLGTTGLLLLVYCTLWIPFALVLAVAVGTGQPAVIFLLLLAGLATVLAEVAGWTLLSMAAVVVVLERAGPAVALRRSWQLVRTRFWRILGILLLTALIYFVISEIIALPFIGGELAVAGGLGRFHVSDLSVALAGLGGIVAGTIARPFLAGATALLYCDTRMRSEGLDLVLRSSGAVGLQSGDADSLRPSPGLGSAAQAPPDGAAW